MAKRRYKIGHHAASLLSFISPQTPRHPDTLNLNNQALFLDQSLTLPKFSTSFPVLSLGFFASFIGGSVGLYVLCHPHLEWRISIIRFHDWPSMQLNLFQLPNIKSCLGQSQQNLSLESRSERCRSAPWKRRMFIQTLPSLSMMSQSLKSHIRPRFWSRLLSPEPTQRSETELPPSVILSWPWYQTGLEDARQHVEDHLELPQ